MAGFDRKDSPTEIVIHGTGGGASAAALIDWMRSGERAKDYSRGIGLFHYLNDFDGSITEIIDPKKWVYHSTSGQHDALTIGIENMNKSPHNDNGYTDKQYTALFELIDELMKKYSIKSIVGHGYNGKKYSNLDKNCPGNFDWQKLGKHLSDKGVRTEYEPRRFNII